MTVEIQRPTGNPVEKLNLMLASGDLPDVILMSRGSDIMNKYITSGAVIPLNDLIEEHGPNIQKCTATHSPKREARTATIIISPTGTAWSSTGVRLHDAHGHHEGAGRRR